MTLEVAVWVGLGQVLAAAEFSIRLGIGFAVSVVVAFFAVKWLLRYLQTHRFAPLAGVASSSAWPSSRWFPRPPDTAGITRVHGTREHAEWRSRCRMESVVA